MVDDNSVDNNQKDDGDSSSIRRQVLEKLLCDPQYGWVLLEWHDLTKRLETSFSESEMKKLTQLSQKWLIHSRGTPKQQELRDIINSMTKTLQDKLKEAHLLTDNEYLPIFFVQDGTTRIPAISASSFSRYLLRKARNGSLQKPPGTIPSDREILPIIEDLTFMEGLSFLQDAGGVIPPDTFAQKLPVPYFLTSETRNEIDELFRTKPFLSDSIFKTWEILNLVEQIKDETTSFFKTLRVFHRHLGETRVIKSLHPKIIPVKINEKELRIFSLDDLVSRSLQELQEIQRHVELVESRLDTTYYGEEGFPTLSSRVEEAFDYLRKKQEYTLSLKDAIWKAWLRLFVLTQTSLVLEVILDQLKNRGSVHPSPLRLESFLHDSQFKVQLETIISLVREELGRTQLQRDFLNNDPMYRFKSTI